MYCLKQRIIKIHIDILLITWELLMGNAVTFQCISKMDNLDQTKIHYLSLSLFEEEGS